MSKSYKSKISLHHSPFHPYSTAPFPSSRPPSATASFCLSFNSYLRNQNRLSLLHNAMNRRFIRLRIFYLLRWHMLGRSRRIQLPIKSSSSSSHSSQPDMIHRRSKLLIKLEFIAHPHRLRLAAHLLQNLHITPLPAETTLKTLFVSESSVCSSSFSLIPVRSSSCPAEIRSSAWNWEITANCTGSI